MPALGMAQESGRLLRWIKRPGEQVAAGDLLMEVETDKSAVEIEATAAGVLGGVLVAEGEEVAVGTTLAWILAPGESAPERNPDELASPRPPAAPPERAGPPLTAPGPTGGRVPASPLARRLAAERGVRLSPGAGTGPGGAYLAADVSVAAPGGEMPRRGTAASTTSVWTTTPHFYLSRQVRARALGALLQTLRRELAVRVTYTDLLLRAAALGLRLHPEISGYWEGGEVRHRATTSLGLAVASPGGLLLATIPEPDVLSIAELAQARERAVARAQQGRLRGADLEPAALSLSNLGMLGVDSFAAVLAPAQSALLAVGRIRDVVVARDGRAVVEPATELTLSCDHRVLDGAVAAPFLAEVAELLEQPERLRAADGQPA